MIYGLLRAQGKTAILLEDLHYQVISEARARGLTYRQMAEEFNERGIRRRDGQPWTARDIKRRWGGLNQLKRARARLTPDSVACKDQPERADADDSNKFTGSELCQQ